MENVMPSRFILASGSPRRRELIASLGINFEIIKPDVDESRRPDELPFDYVTRLSQFKAKAVAQTLTTPAMVLAADTIVLLAADTIGVDEAGDILGKPENADAARVMLRALRDRDHIVCTAFTMMRLGEESQTITDTVKTVVHMRNYSDDEMAAYITSGDPFDKAGSYAIQNTQFNPVATIDGCHNNVIGLPLCAVKRALATLHWPGIIAPEGCDCPAFTPGIASESLNGG
jgi:septum formation protein